MSVSRTPVGVSGTMERPPGSEPAARPKAKPKPADYVGGGALVWLLGSAFYLQGGETRPLGELLVLAAFIWVTLGVGSAGVRSGRRG